MKDRIFTQDEIQELLEDVQNLVSDLGWDYDRMSDSGREVWRELCTKLNIE